MESFKTLLEKVNKRKIFTSFITPLIKGKAQFCFENARLEYWAQKKKNKEVEYWMGDVDGYGIDDDINKYKMPLSHAWVIVNDKISDPTPFKYGIGNFSTLPEKIAKDYWLKGVKYIGKIIVPEIKLQKKLKYFPN